MKSLILPVVVSIIVGIITYHLVEKPSAEFFKSPLKNSLFINLIIAAVAGVYTYVKTK